MNNCELCNRKFTKLNAKFETSEIVICNKCLNLLTNSIFKENHNKVKHYSKEKIKSIYDKKLIEYGIDGDFSDKKNKTCPICKSKISMLKPTYKTLDNYKVCYEHYQLFNHKISEIIIVPYSVYQIEKKISENENLIQEVTKDISEFKPNVNLNNVIFVDEENLKFAIFNYRTTGKIYDLSLIKSFEIIENNNVVSSGGLGRSLLGGLTFGSTGAIIGAVTGRKSNSIIQRLAVKLILSSLEQPVIYLELISSNTKTDSDKYLRSIQIADEILSGLDTVLQRNIVSEENRNISELKEYKKLLDEGLITNDDYEKLKIKLLDIK